MNILLVIFGWSFAIGCLALILVPYLRRKADLLNTRTLFLLGSAVFVGSSAISCGSVGVFYVDLTTRDYLLFFAGVAAFYGMAGVAYRYMGFPRRMAGRWLRKWPPESTQVLFFMLPICLIVSLFSLSPPPIPVVAQLAVQFGTIAEVFALTFAFVAWYKSPVNPILLWTLVLVALYALLFAMIGTSSRRTLLAVLMVLPIGFYWLRLRYRPAGRVLAILGVIGVAGFLVIGAYTTIRHRDSNSGGHGLAFVIESVETIPSKITSTDTGLLLSGQNAVGISLTAIHLYTRDWQPQPFHTLYFILVNPIPRNLWPNKPEALGQTLPRDLGQWRFGYVNWGPGIIGHGFAEGGLYGGLFILMIYGLLAGWIMRFFDELLARQPGNPYLLGMLCAASGQIIAWSRGDIAVFTLQIINSVVVGLILGVIGKIFFGAGLVYPRADELSERYPASHSVSTAP